jgi:hypothetical protein
MSEAHYKMTAPACHSDPSPAGLNQQLYKLRLEYTSRYKHSVQQDGPELAAYLLVRVYHNWRAKSTHNCS